MPPAAHRYPDSAVFYRKLDRAYPVAVRGEGCWIEDGEGRRYLDACGGAFVATLGHGVREVAEALTRQASSLAYVNGTAFTHEPAERLAEEVAARSPGDLDKVYFLSSGSAAVEASLKLARQYWAEAGEPERDVVVSLAPSYHGNTLLALSASAREHYKAYFGGWLVDVVRIPAPYTYRCGCGGRPPLCPACSGRALEEAIARAGPGRVAAVIAEPVGGSSTGASVPPAGYWERVRRICDREDVLLIADEVLTGAGRTGTWSALEPSGVVPDLMILGKGLAAGLAPLSALVAPTRLLDGIASGSGGLLHAQTHSHHPVSCAAGLAVLRHLTEHRLIERCARMGTVLHERLEAFRSLPHVGDVRGRGLLAGVEFVEDTGDRAPFGRELRFAERFTDSAREEGLLVWPNVGHADGTDGDLVCLAPPFVVTEEEIDEIVGRFERALDRTLSELQPTARPPASRDAARSRV